MKKRLLFVGVLLAMSALFAEDITYNDSWGRAGYTLLQSGPDGVEINFSITRFVFEDQMLDGVSMKSVHLPGSFLPNDEGMPNLAGVARYIALPQNADFEFNITDSRTETYSNMEIAPAPHIPFDTEPGELTYEKNEAVYSTNAFYPASPVKISTRKNMRGVDVTILGITPFQYNPVTKELIVYRDLKITISFSGGNGHFGSDRLRNRSWDTILQDMVLNYIDLPKLAYDAAATNELSKTSKTSAAENVEYVIVTPDDPAFIAWADSLKNFRIEQGISTGVITTTEIGGNTFSAIESYVDNAYNNWTTPPSAFLLLGDDGSSGNTVTSSDDYPHPYSGTYVSDNYYADVDGDDLPDIVFSRITARNATELENMVGKILNYERNPPTNPYFYNHPVTAMGWQTSRWFQLCSEVINGFWEYGLGKQPVRENKLYSGGPEDGWSTATNTETVVDYFGPNGLGYIPATPDHLTDFGGNATRINNDINSGAFMVQHRDHGAEDGWSEPSYNISDLSGLHNTDLTFVFSINCLTGRFDYSSECFVEAFHRDSQRALGLIGATQVSYSFVNDTYAWGMYDNMWPEFMPDETTTFPTRFIRPAFANAAGKYFLQGSDWPYNTDDKQITYYLFHHHGDPYSVVYSEVPQNLTVNHNSVLESGATSFTVTADDGSIIALTRDGVILGTADGTGGPVEISIPEQQVGDTVIVTITKQNYYRYRAEVPVVNSSGAYLTIKSYSIDDSDSGNNNGEADFSESVLLNVTAENQGSEAATAVTGTFASTDSNIIITDNTHFYGDFAANQVIAGDGAFAFDVADNVPDQHSAACTVTFAEDGGSQWISNLSIVMNAPVLGSDDVSIDDSATGNGDGNFDEGETVDFTIPVFNSGHADAPNTQAVLSEASEYISITTATIDIGTFAAGDTVQAVYEVTADASTPPGTAIEFTETVTSGEYSTVTTFTVTIGDKVIYLMKDGSETVRNGLFYDTGGKDGDYATGEDLTMTFYAADRSPNVKVNFTSFDLTGYDKLYIFDGSDTSSPQFAGSPFSGTDSPGELVSTNSSGAMTFMFKSNPVLTAHGWEADIYSTAISAVDKPDARTIKSYALRQNYPNPFNPSTAITYQIPAASQVELAVYNLLGEKVHTLVSGNRAAGSHTVRFDAHNLVSGVYYYKITAGAFSQMRKMILIK